MLFRDHREAAILVLELAEYAISSEHQEKHEFFRKTHRMRECLASADTSWEAYCIWRKWTFRKPRYDFGSLSEALRPLYYEVFSLYWSHVETALRPRDPTRLYCDSEQDYRRFFKPQIDVILSGIDEYKEHLVCIVLDPQTSHYDRRHAFEKMLSVGVGRYYRNIRILNKRFVDYRFECFQNRDQRWNMTEYIETVSCVLMELVEYISKIASMFVTVDSEYADLVDRMLILKSRIGQFDTSEFVGVIPVSR
jgi:hypothetical protein